MARYERDTNNHDNTSDTYSVDEREIGAEQEVGKGKRSVLYWIVFALFRAPGKAINWYTYMNPKSGDVMGSRRRYGNPISEIIESLVFWILIIGCILLWLWYRQKI